MSVLNVGNTTIHIGDCRQVLKEMPDQSVSCCVTSPPYFGLRDYGHGGQIGLEQTPADFIEVMVQVFREVRRVLRDDGTLWLNLGDSYASTANGSIGKTTLQGGRASQSEYRRANALRKKAVPEGLKHKDLMGIPWRVALALQADGWWLRQDIIWHKPNPMPESVTDRCTKAHEYIFLLSKSATYHFDQEAILEPCSPNTHARLSQNVMDQIGSIRAYGGGKTDGNMKAVGRKAPAGDVRVKDNESFNSALAIPPTNRNKRSVWTVGTRGFSGAHFATFPAELVEPCILAGCPKGEVVLDPFGGAGTTAIAAFAHDRNAVLIELNPEYAQMAAARIERETKQSDMFIHGAVA